MTRKSRTCGDIEQIRQTVVLHSMVSFVFNVTVLALMVNIASAAIAGS